MWSSAATQVLVSAIAALLTSEQRDTIEFELFQSNFDPEAENYPGAVIYHIEALLDDVAYAKALHFEADWCAATSTTLVDGPSDRDRIRCREAVHAMLHCEWSEACAVAEAIGFTQVGTTLGTLQQAMSKINPGQI